MELIIRNFCRKSSKIYFIVMTFYYSTIYLQMQGHEPILSVLCNKANEPASVSEIKQKGIQ